MGRSSIFWLAKPKIKLADHPICKSLVFSIAFAVFPKDHSLQTKGRPTVRRAFLQSHL
jgi:hypothetical protein